MILVSCFHKRIFLVQLFEYLLLKIEVQLPLSPGYVCIPDGLKFVYAKVALLSERKYDVIISVLNREIEMEKLRPLRAELPAVWSDISNAMRESKDDSLPTHASVGRSAGVGTVQLQSTAQVETRKRRRPSSNVKSFMVPKNGLKGGKREKKEFPGN